MSLRKDIQELLHIKTRSKSISLMEQQTQVASRLLLVMIESLDCDNGNILDVLNNKVVSFDNKLNLDLKAISDRSNQPTSCLMQWSPNF